MARSNVAWGIDIGTSAIKAVKMVAQKGRVNIAAIDIIPFELTGEEIDRDEQIREGLTRLLQSNKLKGERVFVSLPGQAVFNRTITLPPVEAKRIPEIVKYEAQQQIPFPIEEVIWDYQLISEAGAIGEIEVILFAIRKELVNQYIANLSSVGLPISGLQISPLAMYNFVLYDQSLDANNAYCCLDVGSGFTNLVIIQGKKMWLRNVPIAGNDITKVLKDKFQVPFPEAEKLKIKANKSKQAKKIFEVMKPVLRDLVGEVQRSIGFYKAQPGSAKIERILIMGNSTKLINFKKFMASNLQYDVDVLGALQKVPLSRRINIEMFEGNVSGLTVAIGLGLQALGLSHNNIRLIPAENIVEDSVAKMKKPLLVAVLLLGLMTAMMYFRSASNFTNAMSVDRKIHPVKTESQRVREEYHKESIMEAEEKKLEMLARIGRNRNSWISVLQAINSCLPDNGAIKDEAQRIWFITSRLKVEEDLKVEKIIKPDGKPEDVNTVQRRLKVVLQGAIKYGESRSDSFDKVEKVFLSKLRKTLKPGTEELLFSEVSQQDNAILSEFLRKKKQGQKKTTMSSLLP